MQIAVRRDDLERIVAHAAKGVSNRATLPVLSGVCLVAEGEEVTAYGTDLEVWRVETAPAFVDQPGRVVLAGKQLATILRKVRGDVVRIAATDPQEAQVTAGKTVYRVKAKDPADFPELPPIGGPVVPMSADALAEAIRRVLPAVSTDESRQVLTAACMTTSAQPARVTFAATDSWRLAVANVSPTGPVGTHDALIPGLGLKALLPLLKKADDCEVIVADSVTWFRVGAVTVGARNVEGQFPNYQQLIPTRSEFTVTMPRDEAADVLERVALMAQNNLPVKLTLNGAVEMSAHTPDVGEAAEDIEGASWKGDGLGLVVAFNPGFLSDGLKACTGGEHDRVTMLATDGSRPAVFQPTGDDGPSFQYVLMPVRLS